MWVLGIIAAIAALTILIGVVMPVRYEGQTIVEFDRSNHDVWEALQDVEAHPMTGKMMKQLEVLPATDGRPAWKEDMGRGEVITVTTTAYEPPRHMVREMVSASMEMNSRWDYVVEPAGDGTRVTLSGVTDIESGSWRAPIFRVLMVVGGGVKKGLDIQLNMVATTLGTTARRSG